MIDPYASDAEQVQFIKDWLKKYGLSIVLGVAIALVGSFGWRYWQQHTANVAAQASFIYEKMVMAREAKQTKDYQQFAQQLIKDYASTPYAGLAGLFLAEDATLQNDLNTAGTQLSWVVKHAKDDEVKQIAAIRYARVLIAENKAEEALKKLQIVSDDSGYKPAAMIAKGDALVALGKSKEARAAYETALAGLPESAMIKPYVEMKFDQLAPSS